MEQWVRKSMNNEINDVIDIPQICRWKCFVRFCVTRNLAKVTEFIQEWRKNDNFIKISDHKIRNLLSLMCRSKNLENFFELWDLVTIFFKQRLFVKENICALKGAIAGRNFNLIQHFYNLARNPMSYKDIDDILKLCIMSETSFDIMELIMSVKYDQVNLITLWQNIAEIFKDKVRRGNQCNYNQYFNIFKILFRTNFLTFEQNFKKFDEKEWDIEFVIPFRKWKLIRSNIFHYTPHLIQYILLHFIKLPPLLFKKIADFVKFTTGVDAFDTIESKLIIAILRDNVFLSPLCSCSVYNYYDNSLYVNQSFNIVKNISFFNWHDKFDTKNWLYDVPYCFFVFGKRDVFYGTLVDNFWRSREKLSNAISSSTLLIPDLANICADFLFI